MTACRLVTNCSCGGYVTANSVYITGRKTVMIEGYCTACTSQVHAQYKLSDCYKLALGLERQDKTEIVKEVVDPSKGDRDFLKAMHIKENDDK